MNIRRPIPFLDIIAVFRSDFLLPCILQSMARSFGFMQYSIAVEIRRGHESVWRTRIFDRLNFGVEM